MQEEGYNYDEDDEDNYWCDKSKNRTSECQAWLSPEEKAALESARAEEEL